MGAILTQVIAFPFLLGGKTSKKVWAGITLSGAILGALVGNSMYDDKKKKEKLDKWVEDNRENLQRLVSSNCPKDLSKIAEFCREVDNLNSRFRKYSPAFAYFKSSPDEEDLIKAVGYTFYASKVWGEDILNFNSVPVIVSALDLYDPADLKDPGVFDELELENAPSLSYSRNKGYMDSKGKSFKNVKEFVLSRIEEFDGLIEESEGWNRYKEELLRLVNRYLR